MTDPDARTMKTPRGFGPSYNAQAVVTSDQIVVAVDVTQDRSDNHLLAPMTQAAAAALGVVGADRPGGAHCVNYFRLHGSPRRYWSRYEPDYLSRLAQTLAASLPQPAWCIFDNTASGAAFENAYELQRLLDF